MTMTQWTIFIKQIAFWIWNEDEIDCRKWLLVLIFHLSELWEKSVDILLFYFYVWKNMNLWPDKCFVYFYWPISQCFRTSTFIKNLTV